MAEQVFAWLTGQDDNIGDSALRRGYADALRRRGPVTAFVGGASDSYISGLGDVTPIADLDAWLRSAISAATTGPATLAINAGEFTFSGTYTLQLLRILPALCRFRAAGGRVVWLGAAVPSAPRDRAWLFRRLFHAADLIRWRDDATSHVFCVAEAMPDWALALEPSPAAERTALGISLRFDRPYPSPAWIASVRDLAGRLSLDVVAVAQVQRDSPYARRLAADLGGRHVVFPSGRSHAEQEAILRREYAGMAAIVSDRLHALLIGLSEGVVPLGHTESARPKLARHFDSLGLPWVASATLDTVGPDQLAAYANDAAVALSAARTRLAEIGDLLAGDDWRG
ncbi:polysaccharide pyruvyl transferase family protein [Microbacterium indicum]|uniref:polysaccharide pyruvyl transferase family protein n=1 Tax=Microbacterium indicum TaxID=358100 RepID=UPI000418E855|nr:polysaccharide pyruvyl transferase family protein [Microbacterium indicum]